MPFLTVLTLAVNSSPGKASVNTTRPELCLHMPCQVAHSRLVVQLVAVETDALQSKPDLSKAVPNGTLQSKRDLNRAVPDLATKCELCTRQLQDVSHPDAQLNSCAHAFQPCPADISVKDPAVLCHLRANTTRASRNALDGLQYDCQT